MKVIKLDSTGYCDAEQDLCQSHRVTESDEQIDGELKQIQAAFSSHFPQLFIRDDFEFPDWHHNLRLFWVYLYHDDFYSPQLIPMVQKVLVSAPRSWFAEFECYSPALKDEDSNQNGHIGTFLVYKDTAIFDGSEHWLPILKRMNIA